MDINTKKYLKNKKPTNKVWLLACECAEITQTKPQRWLRECKNEWIVRHALDDLKEAIKVAKSRVGLFIWLLKKYKNL